MTSDVLAENRPQILACGIALALAICFVYSGVLDHGFVGYDDGDYVAGNPQVLGGLSAAGLEWAFSTGHAANWHPLTWLSHMLDVELFGVDPGRMAAMNVAIHIAVCLLLLLLLVEWTGALWPAFAATLVFALHPQRVESVAWIAERKDVLAAFFFLATIFAWTRYARRPGVARYAAVALLLVAGLMAKPVLVTLPFLLLLLDYWPLGRLGDGTCASENDDGLLFDRSSFFRRVVEKGPLFLIVFASIGITLVVQEEGGAMRDTLFAPLGERGLNAVHAYLRYLGTTAWPVGLACFYPWKPFASEVSGWAPGLMFALALLGGVSSLAWWQRARRPYLLVGWCWFLGVLVPMLGIIQVGNQSMADRYTYLPTMGISLVLAAGLAEMRRPRWRVAGVVALLAVAAIFVVITPKQVATWRNGETLYRHALAVTEDNYLARFNLGTLLLRASPSRRDEAELQLSEAVRLAPDHGGAQLNLGAAYWMADHVTRAVPHFEAAVRLRPSDPEAHLSLGAARFEQGRVDESIVHFETVVSLRPRDPRAFDNLGRVLLSAGRFAAAEQIFGRLLTLDPQNENAEAGLLEARRRLRLESE